MNETPELYERMRQAAAAHSRSNEARLKDDILIRFAKKKAEKPSAEPFYSHAAKVIEEKIGGQASPEQIRKTLLNAGVKPEEMKWSGLDELLNAAVGPIKKADLLAKANALPKIEEIVKDDKKRPAEVRWRRTQPNWSRAENVASRHDVRLTHHADGTHGWQIDDEDEVGHPTVESAKSSAEKRLKELGISPFKVNETRFGNKDYQLPGGSNYREVLHQWQPEGESGGFKSSHWDEPNVLGHLRLKDYKGPNGEKLLHVDELQSDWHQAGRDKGYKGEFPHEVLKEAVTNGADPAKAEASIRHLMQDPMDRDHRPTGEQWKYLLDHVNNTDLNEVFHDRPQNGVPDAPLKKTWHEHLLKRVLRHAAEHGYDGITWTPGQHQADRYDLSKQISRVDYRPHSKFLEAYGPDGSFVLQKTAEPHEVKDYIGHDLAEKLLKPESSQLGIHRLEGLDLRTGGEGMKGFYDKIVPDYLNKAGKKYGVKVGSVNLKTGETSTPVHHFPLTEEHKKDLLHKGQAFYARKLEDWLIKYAGEELRPNKELDDIFLPQSANEAKTTEPIADEIEGFKHLAEAFRHSKTAADRLATGNPLKKLVDQKRKEKAVPNALRELVNQPPLPVAQRLPDLPTTQRLPDKPQEPSAMGGLAQLGQAFAGSKAGQAAAGLVQGLGGEYQRDIHEPIVKPTKDAIMAAMRAIHEGAGKIPALTDAILGRRTRTPAQEALLNSPPTADQGEAAAEPAGAPASPPAAEVAKPPLEAFLVRHPSGLGQMAKRIVWSDKGLEGTKDWLAKKGIAAHSIELAKPEHLNIGSDKPVRKLARLKAALIKYAAGEGEVRGILAKLKTNPHKDLDNLVFADALEEAHGSPLADLIRQHHTQDENGDPIRQNGFWNHADSRITPSELGSAEPIGEHGPFKLHLNHAGYFPNAPWVVHAVSKYPESRGMGYSFEMDDNEAKHLADSLGNEAMAKHVAGGHDKFLSRHDEPESDSPDSFLDDAVRDIDRGGPHHYARGIEPHPLFARDGVNPWLSHLLTTIAADEDRGYPESGEMATVILGGGHVDNLPHLGEALKREGHPHADTINWNKAHKAVALDHAMLQARVDHNLGRYGDSNARLSAVDYLPYSTQRDIFNRSTYEHGDEFDRVVRQIKRQTPEAKDKDIEASRQRLINRAMILQQDKAADQMKAFNDRAGRDSMYREQEGKIVALPPGRPFTRGEVKKNHPSRLQRLALKFAKKGFVGQKIKRLLAEGKPRDQAIAQALAMEKAEQKPVKHAAGQGLPSKTHSTEHGDVTISAEPHDKGAYTIRALSPAGKPVGTGTLEVTSHQVTGKPVYNLHPHVDELWRRNGIAYAMYDLAEQLADRHGIPLTPSASQTPAAKELWDKRIWEKQQSGDYDHSDEEPEKMALGDKKNVLPQGRAKAIVDAIIANRQAKRLGKPQGQVPSVSREEIVPLVKAPAAPRLDAKGRPKIFERGDKPVKYSHEENAAFHRHLLDRYDWRLAHRAKDESAGHDQTAALVYADWLEEHGHPAAAIVRLAMDPERREAGKRVGMRGMFTQPSSAPDIDGIGISTGIGNKTKLNPDHPIWVSADFAEGGRHGRFITPVSTREARSLADHIDSVSPDHPVAAELRSHADRFDKANKPKKYSREDHAAFAAHMAENPHDKLPALVYADYLAEHGMPVAEAIVREHVDRVGPPVSTAFSGAGINGGTSVSTWPMGSASPNMHSVLFRAHTGDGKRHSSFFWSGPHAQAHDLLSALDAEGHPGAKAALRRLGPPPKRPLEPEGGMREMSEDPERYAAMRAPAGGMIVRGTFYAPGMILPSLTVPSKAPVKKDRLKNAWKKRKAKYNCGQPGSPKKESQ